jgi:hypothetical protein
VTSEFNVNDVMMCEQCQEKLNSAFKFVEKFHMLEAQFFGPARAQKTLVDDTLMNQPATSSVRIGRNKRKVEKTEGSAAKKVRDMKEEESSETLDVAGPKKEGIPEGMKELRVNLFRCDALLKTEDEGAQTSTNADSLQKNFNPPPKAELLENQPRLSGGESMDKYYLKKTANGSTLALKTFFCNFPGCGKVFAFKSGLDGHRASHSGNFPVLLRSLV